MNPKNALKFTHASGFSDSDGAYQLSIALSGAPYLR